MPLDYTHEHSSNQIMRADDVQTPISPSGGPGATPTFAQVLEENDDAEGHNVFGVDSLEADFINLDGDSFGRANDPGDIEAPESATAEDVAAKLNELLGVLRGSGLMNTGGPA